MSGRPPYDIKHGFRGDAGLGIGTGPMPPRAAVPSQTPDQVFSGRELLQLAAAPALPIGLGTGIVSGIWPKPMRRTLMLGTTNGNTSGVGDMVCFPPYASDGDTNVSGLAYVTGFLDAGAQVWKSNSNAAVTQSDRQLACILEVGCGGATSKIVMDWHPGVYRLPPCDYCRVAALAWGGGWALGAKTSFLAAASIIPDEIDGAHVPTATGIRLFAAGETSTLNVPNGARALEVAPFGVAAASANTITVTGASYAVRNYAAGAFVPGWSPVAVDEFFAAGGASVSVTSLLAEGVLLRWYLEI